MVEAPHPKPVSHRFSTLGPPRCFVSWHKDSISDAATQPDIPRPPCHNLPAPGLRRYVQHLSQVHSILATVRAGLGLAPSQGLPLAQFSGHHPAAAALDPVELLMAWRGDHENPLLPTDFNCEHNGASSMRRRLMPGRNRSTSLWLGPPPRLSLRSDVPT
jgi:hypothetical protein